MVEVSPIILLMDSLGSIMQEMSGGLEVSQKNVHWIEWQQNKLTIGFKNGVSLKFTVEESDYWPEDLPRVMEFELSDLE
jgi:hypothetical protein